MTELASRPDLQQSHSPLANLARRTSSRRIKGREQFHWQQPEPVAEYESVLPNDGRNQQKMLYDDTKGTLSINTLSPPHSPLLHTHFARDSIATASSFDDNSYLDTRSGSFPDDHSDYDYRHFEDARDMNVYMEAGVPSLRDPWRSTNKLTTIFHNYSSSDIRPSPPQHPQQVKNAQPSVPSLFISLHDPSMDNSVDSAAIRGGPIVKPVTNFSRPIRESGQPEHTSAVGERVAPQLPPNMREQKLKVLERNARRGMAKSSGESMKTPSLLSQTSMDMDALSIQDGSSSSMPSLTPLNLIILISILTGRNQSHCRQGRSSPSIKDLQPHPLPIISSPHPQSKSSEAGLQSVSRDSLYSTYSYYEYERAAPSPSGSRTPTSEVKQPQRPPSSTSSNRSSPRSPEGLRTPQEYLQLGIQHHEANRLRESARCFERSATEEGGCGVGMLMYGLSLRHGWGCARNEKAGFKWLRKAAEHAVEDLERVRMNGDMDVRVIEVSLNDLVLSQTNIFIEYRLNLCLRSTKWGNASFKAGEWQRIRRWL
jgi:hypothetical protein